MPVCARSEDVAPIPVGTTTNDQVSTGRPGGVGEPRAAPPTLARPGWSQRGPPRSKGARWARRSPGERAFEEDSVKRRYVAAIAVIAALIIAGCSSSGGGTKQASSSGGSKTLTVWLMDGSAPKQLVADLNAEFQASHPNVKVNYQVQQWNGIQDKLT